MKLKNIIRNLILKNVCIYCGERIWKPKDEKHFESCCCGRGMCQSCYDSLQGTDEQWQMDHMEDEDYEEYIEGTNIEGKGDYACFECFDNGNIYKLKNNK